MTYGKNTLEDAIKKKEKQSENFIFDITKIIMTEEKDIFQIEKICLSPYRKSVNKIILIKNAVTRLNGKLDSR